MIQTNCIVSSIMDDSELGAGIYISGDNVNRGCVIGGGEGRR